jgi:POT family proton-dependent oligopeptide transporter
MTKIAEPAILAGTEKPRHPLGLYVLFATEMWERFGFYTMLAMLTLYLRNEREGFGWSVASATRVYSRYLMFVYASPLIGGWIADRLIGFRRSIMIGAVIFSIGYVLLAIPSVPMLYAALVCLVIGNGFFKPNISTLVGNLYPAGSPLRDSAYNIFYMGINIGALLAPLVAEAVRQRFGFHTAFLGAAGGMMLGLIIFAAFQRHVAHADRRSPVPKMPDEETVAVTEDVPPSPEPQTDLERVPEWKRIAALMVVFVIVIVFWMGFHQNGSTFTYFANDNTDWGSSPVVMTLIKILTLGTVDAAHVSGVISNSINPFWIVVLSLPLVQFWRWLNRRGLEPSTPTKMALGMTLTAAAFFILFLAGRAGGDTGRVSPWWLISAYFVISLAELMLSPMGLSLVSKVAPARMRGLLMGGWFVATAIGNSLTQIGEYWDDWSHSNFFALLGSFCLGMAIVLYLLIRPLKRAMPGV